VKTNWFSEENVVSLCLLFTNMVSVLRKEKGEKIRLNAPKGLD
jgi:hypothetical protein